MAYLSFISDLDLINHVKNTLLTYSNTIQSYNLSKFNSNIIDPIKLTFDSRVYVKDIENIIVEEIARQRDKSNTNAIGYFHQNIFKYIYRCEVPSVGFDIIFDDVRDNTKIFIEMKNKHNTMNSSSSQKTYMKMQNKILEADNYRCFLVEVIATRNQNVVWQTSLDYQTIRNDRIRRVSIDQFYKLVTGEKDSFMNLCKVLPKVIDDIIEKDKIFAVQKDTVIDELKSIDIDLLKALYKIAFSTYEGFDRF